MYEIAKTIKTYKGHEIGVFPDTGEFTAELPGRKPLRRQSLADIEREIDKLGTPVKIFEFDQEERISSYRSRRYAPQPVVVTEMKRQKDTHYYGSRPGDQYTERVRTRDGDWKDVEGAAYVWDDGVVKNLERAIKERNEKLEALQAKHREAENALHQKYEAQFQDILSAAHKLEKVDFKQK